MKLTIQITGMHCDHCIKAIESAMDQLPGIVQHTVRAGDADISLDESVTNKNVLFNAIRNAGSYDIVGFKCVD